MLQTIQLTPGVTLRYYPDKRFKKNALSIQLLRPMCWEEVSANALLPAIFLRGTRKHPDLRSITWRLDELYGAGVGTLVRRVGDIQTVGLALSVMDDRFALEPEGVLAPAVDFLRELLLEPLTEAGVFVPAYVESEKKNLISAIESELNDKRSYAAKQTMSYMCAGDSYAIPRLGTVESVAELTPEGLWKHYRKILRESPVEVFYCGSADVETVQRLLRPLTDVLGTEAGARPTQTGFVPQAPAGEHFETMEINQGKLCMGFTTGVTNRDPDAVAMQMLNVIYGTGMTSKLFVNVREKMSLCYYAGSSYFGSKGIMMVSSGIDEANYEKAKEEILHQLQLCAQGEITPEEIDSARRAMISSLQGIPDSPGALESHYGTEAVNNRVRELSDFMNAVEAVTLEDLVRCASGIRLQTVYFLKGEQA